MKPRSNRRFFLLPIFLLVAAYARAGLIYDNGAPDNYHGSEMTHWIDADDFVLTQPTRLESIRFWDFEIEGYFAGSLTWQIYADNGNGLPGLLLFSGTSANLTHVATGVTIFGGFAEFVGTFDILPISLPAGTYWLALHNGPLTNNESDNFFWEGTNTSGGSPSHRKIAPFTNIWVSNASSVTPGELAFQIFGAPLPRLTAFAVQADARKISFSTSAGYTYRIDYKDRLFDASWTLLPAADAVAGTGSVVQITDSDPKGGASRFYRVGFSYSGAGAPVISSFGLGAGGPEIRFSAAAGYYYRVEYKNDLTDSSWSAVPGGEMIIGSGGVVRITDSDQNLPAQSHRLYRVVLF